MDHFTEYWFFKYDNESFEKDFQKVSYMDAVQMMVILNSLILEFKLRDIES